MGDWTPEAIEAAHCAMFQEPYDGTTAAMIGAGLDAAAAAQGMQADNALREENARLREALKPFAKLNWSEDWHDGSDCEINVQLRDIRRAAALVDGYVWTPDE